MRHERQQQQQRRGGVVVLEDPINSAAPRLRRYLAEARWSGEAIALDAYGRTARMFQEFLGTPAGARSGFVAQDDSKDGVVWLVHEEGAR